MPLPDHPQFAWEACVEPSRPQCWQGSDATAFKSFLSRNMVGHRKELLTAGEETAPPAGVVWYVATSPPAGRFFILC